MITVKKSDLDKALRFCALVSDYAKIELDDEGLHLSASFYQGVAHHYAHIRGDGDGNSEGYVEIDRVRRALTGHRRNVDVDMSGGMLVLQGDILTTEIALESVGDVAAPRQDGKRAVIRFYPLPMEELRRFLKLANTISDTVHISVDGTALLHARNIDGDELIYLPENYEGKGKGIFSAERLANAASFLKGEYAELAITDIGALNLEVVADTLQIRALLAPVLEVPA